MKVESKPFCSKCQQVIDEFEGFTIANKKMWHSYCWNTREKELLKQRV